MRIYIQNLSSHSFEVLYTVPSSLNFELRGLYVANFLQQPQTFSLCIYHSSIQTLETLLSASSIEEIIKSHCTVLLYRVQIKDNTFIFEPTHPVVLNEETSLIVVSHEASLRDIAFFANLWRTF